MSSGYGDDLTGPRSLGIVEMPKGYELHQLDCGHWLYYHPATDAESCIHWNKWAIYRWAMEASQRADDA